VPAVLSSWIITSHGPVMVVDYEAVLFSSWKSLYFGGWSFCQRSVTGDRPVGRWFLCS